MPGSALCGDQVRGEITKTGFLSSVAKEKDDTMKNPGNPKTDE